MSSFPQGVTVYMVLGLRVSVTVTHQFHYSAYLPSFNFVCFKFSLTEGDRAGEQLQGNPTGLPTKDLKIASALKMIQRHSRR